MNCVAPLCPATGWSEPVHARTLHSEPYKDGHVHVHMHTYAYLGQVIVRARSADPGNEARVGAASQHLLVASGCMGSHFAHCKISEMQKQVLELEDGTHGRGIRNACQKRSLKCFVFI
ncbi:hypothetical protein FVE85_3193 [Porphyridium purpureum]|uniref:Uncharacterized protein n=1 Tax=Porphyridium purpureum TaxID=35688 RepID=A0A5J4YVS1_PORPP|nr:hypothetical protein FVE85_3193 [Porphyridium purpureum]|eukprot:POR8726..scf227_4